MHITNIKNYGSLLTEYKTYLIVIKVFAASTVTKYYEIADKFIFYMLSNGIKYLKNIKQRNINSFIIELQSKKKLSLNTLNLNKSSINAFIVFLCKQYDFCKLNTFKSYKLQKNIYSVIEDYKMLELIKRVDPDNKQVASWINYRNFAMLLTLYSTGIRISELLKMKLTDIDENWLRIDNSKNGVTRVVPVNNYMLLAIENYKDMCPYVVHKVLWFNRDGKRLKAAAASNAIKIFSGYSAHYYRHAFATHLLKNGCDLLVLKEFVGHSSISTTSIYTHIQPNHLLETVVLCHPMNELDADSI